MQADFETHVEFFLRSYLDRFTARDLVSHVRGCGTRLSEKQADELIRQSPYVYALSDGTYVTRAAVFTDEYFSIKPTQAELSQGVFAVGGRCIPFVDDEMLPSGISFSAGGETLSQKVATFDSDFAIDLYQFYGEEYAPQYIASDPANSGINFVERNYELPATVALTCVDIEPLVRRFSFREGDRLLCRVTDWNRGHVSVAVLHSHNDVFDAGPGSDERLAWYAGLESFLLESFENSGPCSSIAEQLEIVFFDHRDKLCAAECGSVEEFIGRYAKKVALEHYGVETRLWRKGELVPAIGTWNDAQVALYEGLDFVTVANTMENRAIYSTPDCIYDEFIRDMLFSRKDNLEELFDYIYGSDYSFSKSQRHRLLLHMSERNAILAPTYNWFADQTKGPVRHETLDLYRKVSSLAYRIECSRGKLEKYPQQELVILSQLNGHLLRMIMSFETDAHVEEDADALLLSVDGMRFTFEDIEDILESAFETQRLGQFKVRK